MKGRAWIFGDNVSTDAIIPGRFMDRIGVIPDDEWKNICFIDHEPSFAKEVKPGDFIVAGKNFGTGSSREVAPLAIKKAGIACIIAQSFARIFFRNCINLGLPAVTAGEELMAYLKPLELIDVDWDKGWVRLEETKKTIAIAPMPPFARKIAENGGLLAYALTKEK